MDFNKAAELTAHQRELEKEADKLEHLLSDDNSNLSDDQYNKLWDRKDFCEQKITEIYDELDALKEDESLDEIGKFPKW